MVNRSEYKEALGRLDRDNRLSLLYLEGMIDEKFKTVMNVKKPQPPKVNLSDLESKADSLQKQINGLRKKVDLAYNFVQEHDDQEKYLKKMTKKVEAITDDMKQHFEELYNSGYYSEGTKRKLRDDGLIKRKS